jgi:osmotically-inducible protein OsmY
MSNGRRILVLLMFVALIILSGGCATTPTSESAGQYIDDSVITAKVKAAIVQEPTLNYFQIGVETYKGVVQLSGFVDSAADVARAGEVTRAVKGVVSVKNDLIVK